MSACIRSANINLACNLSVLEHDYLASVFRGDFSGRSICYRLFQPFFF